VARAIRFDGLIQRRTRSAGLAAIDRCVEPGKERSHALRNERTAVDGLGAHDPNAR